MKNIAIITGGSSGLGRSIAQQLVAQKINVCIIARNKSRLGQVVEELNHDSVAVESYAFDISNEQAVAQAYHDLKNKGYHIQYLFNVAGIGIFGAPTSITYEKIMSTLDANLIGLMLMTTHALKAMERAGGKIINIMSTAAIQGKPNEAMYCAAKWGAKGYTESLKAAYKDSNIDIIGIYPGGMNTAFWDQSDVDLESFMDPDEVAKQILYASIHDHTLMVSDIIIRRK